MIPIYLVLGALLLQLNPSEFFPNLFMPDESQPVQHRLIDGQIEIDSRALSPAERDGNPPDYFGEREEENFDNRLLPFAERLGAPPDYFAEPDEEPDAGDSSRPRSPAEVDGNPPNYFELDENYSPDE